MTTQTTTFQPSTKGARTLIGAAAASLAVLGGALLWQARPASETTAPSTATAVSTMAEPDGAHSAPVYLVSIDAEAGALRQELGMTLESDGRPAAPPLVLVAGSVEAENLPLPPGTRIIDARGEATAAGTRYESGAAVARHALVTDSAADVP